VTAHQLRNGAGRSTLEADFGQARDKRAISREIVEVIAMEIARYQSSLMTTRTLACESQDFRDIQSPDRGGRFIVKSSVTSCRSSADEIPTISHFPSGYVLASS
jgi:hypothetical protein